LEKLKKEVMSKKEATEMFGQEKQKGSIEGIVGTVFQTVFEKDAYPTLEEKSAHLLYFIIKNHPFIDGNKRSGAFAFIWFLQKAKISFQNKINPETLATLTLLIAESHPKDKEKMIGIILLLLNAKKEL
jgi:death-on-curing family protein